MRVVFVEMTSELNSLSSPGQLYAQAVKHASYEHERRLAGGRLSLTKAPSRRMSDHHVHQPDVVLADGELFCAIPM